MSKEISHTMIDPQNTLHPTMTIQSAHRDVPVEFGRTFSDIVERSEDFIAYFRNRGHEVTERFDIFYKRKQQLSEALSCVNNRTRGAHSRNL